MRLKHFFAVLIIPVFLFAFLSQAAASIGKITAVEGSVDITPSGQKAMPALKGSLLNVNDLIRVRSKSKAELTFDDGNVVRLGENSRLRIAEYMFKTNERNESLKLLRGKAQAVVSTAIKIGRFEVATPTAVVGVRGTDFFVYYQSGVSGAVFKSGVGYGYNPNYPQNVQTINPGQAFTVAAADQNPTVRQATNIEIQQHTRDTSISQGGGGSSSSSGSGSGSGTGSGSGIEGLGSASSGLGQGTGSSNLDLGQGSSTNTGYNSSGLTNVGQLNIVNLPPSSVVPYYAPQITLNTFPDTVSGSQSASFGYSTSSSGSYTMSYELDGGNWSTTNQTLISFSGLAEGNHVFELMATDSTGNSKTAIMTGLLDSRSLS